MRQSTDDAGRGRDSRVFNALSREWERETLDGRWRLR
jgi:hypothetical protein